MVAEHRAFCALLHIIVHFLEVSCEIINLNRTFIILHVMCLLYSMSATLDAVKLFTAAAAAAKSTTYKDKVYKCVWDKAQLYVDQQELPSSWDCAQLLGNMDLGDSDEVC